MSPFNKNYLELLCKLFVIWWLDIYEPQDWRAHGPYLTIMIDKEKDWYFDMAPGKGRYNAKESLGYSVGISVTEMPFYWLYPFDPDVKPQAFDESKWNHEEFDLMVKEFEQEGELENLIQGLIAIAKDLRRRLPVDPNSYYISQQPGYHEKQHSGRDGTAKA